KRVNYALRAQSKGQFVAEVLDGLTKAPAYFAQNARLNQEGYESIDAVMDRGEHALTPDAFEALVNETGALVLDVRNEHEFSEGFIPNAINIGLDGQFAPWVGALIPDLKQPIALVTPVGQETETIKRLARVGYDNCIGYLDGGFAAWQQTGKEVDVIESVSPDAVAGQPAVPIIDVRREAEFAAERVKGAWNLPLDTINDAMDQLDRKQTYFIHCAGGYRSMIAASILRARGFNNLINIDGGLAALKQTGRVPIVTEPLSH
ncbi:MAG: rhodanese-like domain-containing protein, partial [Bacteroidetes bacterium]|nr:rhodanese-like domain-containing protein [Fibrella sp.]